MLHSVVGSSRSRNSAQEKSSSENSGQCTLSQLQEGKLSASDADLAQVASRYFQALVSLLGTHGQWHLGQCSEIQRASYI